MKHPANPVDLIKLVRSILRIPKDKEVEGPGKAPPPSQPTDEEWEQRIKDSKNL